MYGVFDCSFYRVAEDLEVIAPLLKKHGIAGVSIPAHCLNSRDDALRARRLIEESGMPSRPTTTHFPTRCIPWSAGRKMRSLPV